MYKIKLITLFACAMLGAVSMVSAAENYHECSGQRVAAGTNSSCTNDQGAKALSALDKVTRKLSAGLRTGSLGPTMGVHGEGFKSNGVIACVVNTGSDGATQSTTCPTGTVAHQVWILNLI